MAQLDRRVRRTRRYLRDALMELILEKGYDTITIQDITDRADLSRATFYLHYKDKEDLLINTLVEMFDDLVSTKGLLPPAETFMDNQNPPSLLAFQHVQEYGDMYKALLSERGVAYVVHRNIDYLAAIAQSQIEALLPSDAAFPVPLPILARHVAGSLFALIVWWLKNDMPHSPEYMAKVFHSLAIPGVLNTIGIAIELDRFKPEA